VPRTLGRSMGFSKDERREIASKYLEAREILEGKRLCFGYSRTRGEAAPDRSSA
jgi:hypothetical protein